MRDGVLDWIHPCSCCCVLQQTASRRLPLRVPLTLPLSSVPCQIRSETRGRSIVFLGARPPSCERSRDPCRHGIHAPFHELHSSHCASLNFIDQEPAPLACYTFDAGKTHLLPVFCSDQADGALGVRSDDHYSGVVVATSAIRPGIHPEKRLDRVRCGAVPYLGKDCEGIRLR